MVLRISLQGIKCLPNGNDIYLTYREESVEEPVLQPEWQINPLDIYFCSKKDNKLLKLGKGGFGTVRHHSLCKTLISQLAQTIFGQAA